MPFELCSERKKGETNSKYQYRLLRENIMTFRLLPGETLDETVISEQFGTSRTPVREALILLKNEKLVDILPQKGSKVSYIDLKLVRQGYFTRRVVETAICKEIAGMLSEKQLKQLKQILLLQDQEVKNWPMMSDYFLDLDNKMHQFFYEFSSNQEIWSSLHDIGTHYDRVRYLDTKSNDTNLEQIMAEHHQLYYYLMMGIPPEVDFERFMTGHLGRFLKELPGKIKLYPHYFKE